MLEKMKNIVFAAAILILGFLLAKVWFGTRTELIKNIVRLKENQVRLNTDLGNYHALYKDLKKNNADLKELLKKKPLTIEKTKWKTKVVTTTLPIRDNHFKDPLVEGWIKDQGNRVDLVHFPHYFSLVRLEMKDNKIFYTIRDETFTKLASDEKDPTLKKKYYEYSRVVIKGSQAASRKHEKWFYGVYTGIGWGEPSGPGINLNLTTKWVNLGVTFRRDIYYHVDLNLLWLLKRK